MPTTTWTDRVWREHRAGNLTRAWRDVLLTLRTYRGPGGLAWPSHATLAERASCCVRTVQRALQAGRRLGLVSWAERRIRAAWRWLRQSNSYRLEQPAGPVQPGKSTTGHRSRGGERLKKEAAQQGRKAVLAELLREAAEGPDLLKARREAVMAQWLARSRAP